MEALRKGRIRASFCLIHDTRQEHTGALLFARWEFSQGPKTRVTQLHRSVSTQLAGPWRVPLQFNGRLEYRPLRTESSESSNVKITVESPGFRSIVSSTLRQLHPLQRRRRSLALGSSVENQGSPESTDPQIVEDQGAVERVPLHRRPSF